MATGVNGRLAQALDRAAEDVFNAEHMQAAMGQPSLKAWDISIAWIRGFLSGLLRDWQSIPVSVRLCIGARTVLQRHGHLPEELNMSKQTLLAFAVYVFFCGTSCSVIAAALGKAITGQEGSWFGDLL